jgi:hypothetical protein
MSAHRPTGAHHDGAVLDPEDQDRRATGEMQTQMRPSQGMIADRRAGDRIGSALSCAEIGETRAMHCAKPLSLSLSLSLSRSRSSLAAWSRLCARPGAGVVCGRRDALMRAHRSPTRPACVGARVRVLHLKEPVRAPPRVGGIPIPWCSQRFQRRESPVPSPLHGGRGVTLLRPLWSGAGGPVAPAVPRLCTCRHITHEGSSPLSWRRRFDECS